MAKTASKLDKMLSSKLYCKTNSLCIHEVEYLNTPKIVPPKKSFAATHDHTEKTSLD